MKGNGSRGHGVVAAWAFVAVFFLAQGSLRADEALKPAWVCLPETTFFVIRLPSLARFGDAMAEQTRLGAAWNSTERWRSALDFFCRQRGGAWEDAEHALSAHDLKLEDWHALVSGEIGWACMFDLEQVNGSGIFWIEPEEELGNRLWKWFDAWTRQLAETPGMQRKDETIGDNVVIHLSGPIYASDAHGTMTLAGGFNFHSGIQWSIALFPDAATDENKRGVEAYGHMFVARAGRRIFLVHSMPSGYENEDGTVDTSEETENFHRATMASVLERHARDVPPAEWLAEAIARAPRDGTPLYEAFCNAPMLIQDIMAWWEEVLNDAETPFPLNSKILFDLVAPAARGIGTVTVRNAIDAARAELVVKVDMPAPRPGLLALFDYVPVPAEPVPWAPASTKMYSQIALDGAALGELLASTMRSLRRDENFEAYAALEDSLHVDFAELLAGLGPRVLWISLDQDASRSATNKPAISGAVAWQLRNDAMWQRFLEGIAQLFDLKLLRQDGYVGVDIDVSSFKGVGPWNLLAGHGYLILDGGKDPTGPPLATIDQADADARSNPVYQRAVGLLPGPTAFSLAFTDWRSAEATRAWLADLPQRMVDLSIVPAENTQKDRNRAKGEFAKGWWQALLGDAADEPLLGVSASRTDVDQRGVTYRSALEFTPSQR